MMKGETVTSPRKEAATVSGGLTYSSEVSVMVANSGVD